MPKPFVPFPLEAVEIEVTEARPARPALAAVAAGPACGRIVVQVTGRDRRDAAREVERTTAAVASGRTGASIARSKGEIAAAAAVTANPARAAGGEVVADHIIVHRERAAGNVEAAALTGAPMPPLPPLPPLPEWKPISLNVPPEGVVTCVNEYP